MEVTPWIKDSNGDFVEAKPQSRRGSGYRLDSDGTDKPSTVAYRVPLVGSFGEDSPRFLFERPTAYQVKWEVNARPGGLPSSTVEQSIVVGAPLRADLEFIKELGSMDFLLTLYKVDPFGELEPPMREWAHSAEAIDFRALHVIRELLLAAEANEPGDLAGPRGREIDDLRRWADALSALAGKFPGSSYAPYANYFSGCSYLLCMASENKTKHGQLRSATAKNTDFYNKAIASLHVSAASADEFLRPQIFFMQSFLHNWADELEEATRVLLEAANVAEGNAPAEKKIASLKKELVRE